MELLQGLCPSHVSPQRDAGNEVAGELYNFDFLTKYHFNLVHSIISYASYVSQVTIRILEYRRLQQKRFKKRTSTEFYCCPRDCLKFSQELGQLKL